MDREALVELVALAAIAGEHVLVVGPPGTGKSEAVSRVARALGGRYFEYLLGRFTEPSELFGPVDLKKLRDGVVETRTEGMLPEAEIAFLDEVFLGSTAILNTLLGILNERRFRRGQTEIECPLRVCVGATNNLPEEDALAAFGDRFLVHFFVDPLPDHQLEALLEGGWSRSATPEPVGLKELDRLSAIAQAADLGPVRPALAQALRTLKREGITLSDRRTVKVQRLIAATAALSGRTTPTEADLWPLVYAVPNKVGQEAAKEALKDLLGRAESAALAHAAEQASNAPAARAARLVNVGLGLFAERPSESNLVAGWRLKLEGVAKEIDAGFEANQRPAELEALRTRIVAETQAQEADGAWVELQVS